MTSVGSEACASRFAFAAAFLALRSAITAELSGSVESVEVAAAFLALARAMASATAEPLAVWPLAVACSAALAFLIRSIAALTGSSPVVAFAVARRFSAASF